MKLKFYELSDIMFGEAQTNQFIFPRPDLQADPQHFLFLQKAEAIGILSLPLCVFIMSTLINL